MPLIENQDYTTLREARIKKLPAWARREIKDKDRTIADLTKRIEELTADHQGSRVVANPYSDSPQPLPSNTDVTFSLAEKQQPRKFLSEGVRVRIEREDYGEKRFYLDVTATHGMVVIHPRSGNSFQLFVEC